MSALPDPVSIKTFFLSHQKSINAYLWDAIDEADQERVDILETRNVKALVDDLLENHSCELREMYDNYSNDIGKYNEQFDSVEEMVYSGVEWYVKEYDMKPSTCKG